MLCDEKPLLEVTIGIAWHAFGGIMSIWLKFLERRVNTQAASL
jgi:hypothetical protein